MYIVYIMNDTKNFSLAVRDNQNINKYTKNLYNEHSSNLMIQRFHSLSQQ